MIECPLRAKQRVNYESKTRIKREPGALLYPGSPNLAPGVLMSLQRASHGVLIRYGHDTQTQSDEHCGKNKYSWIETFQGTGCRRHALCRQCRRHTPYLDMSI